MAEKSEDRGASHAMLGLNDSGAATPTGYSAGAPQPVYMQAPSPPWGFSGGQVLFLMVLALIVLSGVNLYLVITARQRLNNTFSRQADELDLLTRRLDSSDERYAQLRGQFQVTTEKLGLTQQELSRARS